MPRSDVEFSVAVHDDEDRETLRRLASVVQGADESAARAEILGTKETTDVR